MNGFVRVASATPPMKLGDVEYNAAKIAAMIDEAKERGASLVVFPELCLCGYTMGDLAGHRVLVESCELALETLKERSRGIAVVVGLPAARAGKLYNVAAVLSDGRIIAAVPKMNLPTSGEFYELRNFCSGKDLRSITLCGEEVPCRDGLVMRHMSLPDFTFGVEICMDMWAARSPAEKLALGGARIICNPSASAETAGKADIRRLMVRSQSAKLIAGYVYSNSGAGESSTDSVYAGHRLVAEDGALLVDSGLFTEGLTVTEIDLDRINRSRAQANTFSADEEGIEFIEFDADIFDGALTRQVPTLPFIPVRDEDAEVILKLQAAGLKRRMDSCACDRLLIGLSGGLDSALALLVCLRAAPVGAVTAVSMPCFGTGERTKNNARALCAALQVELKEIPLSDAVRAHLLDLGRDESVHDSLYENAQARERTQVLMDMANGVNGLVVGTGDMSELALGWCTYNGDHMSGYGVNAGVPKTLVKHLALFEAARLGGEAGRVLKDIAATDISPELLPPSNGVIVQKTEEILGKYEYHDFFLYYGVRWAYSPAKVMYLALNAFGEDKKREIKSAMKIFYKRFFSQQFKRSCLPDGVKVVSLSLSPRSDLKMPSDASAALWLKQVEEL